MSNYLKLVRFEMQRFWKLYIVLIAVVAVSQITGVFMKVREYLDMAQQQIQGTGVSKEEFLQQSGQITLERVVLSGWFILPIMFCIVTLVIYTFFIWYRDWLGKNTFIYRLLMLPTARINLYFAKATTIFLMVLGLVALQIILLPIENSIFQAIAPMEYRSDMTVFEVMGPYSVFGLIIPATWERFLIHYLLGFISVFVIFTAILLERSYRLKGIGMAIIFVLLSQAVFIAPILLQITILDGYFYPMELILLQVLTGVIVLVGAILLANYLLNKKIRV